MTILSIEASRITHLVRREERCVLVRIEAVQGLTVPKISPVVACWVSTLAFFATVVAPVDHWDQVSVFHIGQRRVGAQREIP